MANNRFSRAILLRRYTLVQLGLSHYMITCFLQPYQARSASCLDSQLHWTGIELRPIGRVSIGTNGLPSRIFKLLPISCLTIAVAYDEDAPLCREVCLTKRIAADHRRRNVGVAAKRRFMIVAGVAQGFFMF